MGFGIRMGSSFHEPASCLAQARVLQVLGGISMGFGSCHTVLNTLKKGKLCFQTVIIVKKAEFTYIFRRIC